MPGGGRWRRCRAAGAPVELTVAVDGQGAGGLGVTLVPEVLGQPEATARQLLSVAGLDTEVLAGCDADPARAAAEPGRVWRSGPAPGTQAPTGTRVRPWANPPSCPPAATTTTPGPTTTSRADRWPWRPGPAPRSGTPAGTPWRTGVRAGRPPGRA